MKVIKIESCDDCLLTQYVQQLGWVCMQGDFVVKLDGTVPDKCPLEDYEGGE